MSPGTNPVLWVLNWQTKSIMPSPFASPVLQKAKLDSAPVRPNVSELWSIRATASNVRLDKTADFRAASVWFYCKRDRERKVCDTIQFSVSPVLGKFTGYFHFVPDQKSRLKDVFDPGPLQLEVVGVSDLATNTKPNTFRPATPHN